MTGDKESVFTGNLIKFILSAIKCKLQVINLFNHGSLKTEIQIQIIGKMNSKWLTGKWEVLSCLAAVAAHEISIFASPSFSGFSPVELDFVWKPLDLLNLPFCHYRNLQTFTKITCITERKDG